MLASNMNLCVKVQQRCSWCARWRCVSACWALITPTVLSLWITWLHCTVRGGITRPPSSSMRKHWKYANEPSLQTTRLSPILSNTSPCSTSAGWETWHAHTYKWEIWGQKRRNIALGAACECVFSIKCKNAVVFSSVSVISVRVAGWGDVSIPPPPPTPLPVIAHGIRQNE